MSKEKNTPAGKQGTIIHALELQLASLDQIGANIAAAHVDAAINQLRRDQAMALL
ncbi:MAG: hypothetical protein ABJ239_12070 [Erythrobacter sp.]